MFVNTAEFPATFGPARGRFDYSPLRAMLAVLLAAAALFGLRELEALRDRVAQVLNERVTTDFARRASHVGLYRGEVVAAGLRIGESQEWIIHLEQRNHHRVVRAKLQVRVWMPETDIASTPSPTVTYLGGGNYRLNDVRITRPGWWNVALVVNARAGVDSLAFNVRLQ